MLQNAKQLTAKELRVFTTNCNELLEYIRLYGIPYETDSNVINKMMAYRLKGIKARPKLLQVAKTIDVNGICFN